MKSRHLFIASVFAASLAYAVVRYIVIKGVPGAHVPVFIVNKAVAMTALALLGFSVAARATDSRRYCGRAALAAAGTHALLSLSILSPAYFPKFYLGAGFQGGFNLSAESALLAGVIGLVVVAALGWRMRAPGAAWSRGEDLAALGGLFMAAVHCLIFGWTGWWHLSEWPGGLPPITLISFLYVLGVTFRKAQLQRRGLDLGAAGKEP